MHKPRNRFRLQQRRRAERRHRTHHELGVQIIEAYITQHSSDIRAAFIGHDTQQWIDRVTTLEHVTGLGGLEIWISLRGLSKTGDLATVLEALLVVHTAHTKGNLSNTYKELAIRRLKHDEAFSAALCAVGALKDESLARRFIEVQVCPCRY